MITEVGQSSITSYVQITQQRMCTTRNCVKSEFFATENVVKQGDISPTMHFCVYIDELLSRILSSVAPFTNMV